MFTLNKYFNKTDLYSKQYQHVQKNSAVNQKSPKLNIPTHKALVYVGISMFKQYVCRNTTFAKDKYLLVVDSPGSDTLTHTRTGTVEKRLSFCFIEHYNVTQPTI